MASTHKHIRSGTANKRPTTAIAEGQIALATNITSPGLFFKDSTGATIVKIGPVHVGATAPNASPAGSAGNSIGEVWLDNSLTPIGVKIYDGSAFVNATPIGSTTVQGLLELATDAETQAGADTARAVTSASLQSKLSDSTSTTSNTTIASSTAVKTAYDLANAALPKTGGTVTGNLEIGAAGSLSFEGATADGFETTIAITDPTADRTITLPNTTGTVVTTGDSGTVTSTMILDGTIVDADINASAEISVSKLADGSARQLLQTDAAGTGVEWASNIDIPGTLDVTSAATFDSSVAVTGALTKSGSNVVTVGDTGTVTSTMILDGTILNADVNASAAIAGTKISPDFGAQTIVTTGVHSAALGAAATPSITFTGDLNTGIYSPGADQVAVATNGTGRLFVNGNGQVSVVGVVTSNTNLTVNGATSFSATSNWNFPGLLLRRTASNIATAKQISFLLDGDTESETTLTNYLNIWGTYSGTPTTSSTSTALSASINLGAPNAFIAHTNGSERLRITSAGLVGIGISSPGCVLQAVGSATVSSQVNVAAQIGSNTTSDVLIGSINGNTPFVASQGAYPLQLRTNNAAALTIDSSQRVGIGITSPSSTLTVGGNTPTAGAIAAVGANGGIALALSDNVNSSLYVRTASVGPVMGTDSGNVLRFATNGNATTDEKARIDISGRLLVGTSTNTLNINNTDKQAIVLTGDDTYGGLAITGYNGTSNPTLRGPRLTLQRSRGTTDGSMTKVALDDLIGQISFRGADGTDFEVAATIEAYADGEFNSSSNATDSPGRLVFATSPNGSSSPTPRMTITSNGAVLIAKTADDVNTQGIRLSEVGVGSFARDGDIPLFIHRGTDDGALVVFRQGGADEGNISVSGTTVSYNGAHLSRWSQLPSGAERTEILRGSVLSNIDEMCEWSDEENEQLNRMKVSDVEGDKNVSGVFQAWDDDDDTYTNDFYCAMTGDFIIRIAAGTIVERGDLLMSAGDGTAKPQDDDIIRSKTIAKVTSTNVSCTYGDGSYCVPCVLMAC